jgi:hypothetical protein
MRIDLRVEPGLRVEWVEKDDVMFFNDAPSRRLLKILGFNNLHYQSETRFNFTGPESPSSECSTWNLENRRTVRR